MNKPGTASQSRPQQGKHKPANRSNPAPKGSGGGHGKGGHTPHRGTRKPQIQTRGSGDQYWLYGTHAVLAALANPSREVLKVWVGERQREALPASALAARPNLKIETVKPELFRSILPEHAVHQQIASEVKALPELGLETLLQSPRPGAIILLDQVSDPQNMGAVLRSAAAFNAKGIITTERNSASETSAVAKAAAGALETVPVVTIPNLANAILVLKSNGFWVAGLDGKTHKGLDALPTDKPVALALGAEGRGLRPLTAERCDLLVKIPISDAVESLNVSNAAAIVLYSLTRYMFSPAM